MDHTKDEHSAMASTYADYLSMRENRGYDLTNTVYQFPHDLDEAHEKMVEEVNKEELDKHLKDVAARFPNIRHSYRKLRNKYYYEDDTYIIRPAKSAEEIVTEGRVLHHCVGGDNYLGKHNRGETYILFLRFKDTPNMQYRHVRCYSGYSGSSCVQYVYKNYG